MTWPSKCFSCCGECGCKEYLEAETQIDKPPRSYSRPISEQPTAHDIPLHSLSPYQTPQMRPIPAIITPARQQPILAPRPTYVPSNYTRRYQKARVDASSGASFTGTSGVGFGTASGAPTGGGFSGFTGGGFGSASYCGSY
jgi:hypothetical protein